LLRHSFILPRTLGSSFIRQARFLTTQEHPRSLRSTEEQKQFIKDLKTDFTAPFDSYHGGRHFVENLPKYMQHVLENQGSENPIPFNEEIPFKHSGSLEEIDAALHYGWHPLQILGQLHKDKTKVTSQIYAKLGIKLKELAHDDYYVLLNAFWVHDGFSSEEVFASIRSKLENDLYQLQSSIAKELAFRIQKNIELAAEDEIIRVQIANDSKQIEELKSIDSSLFKKYESTSPDKLKELQKDLFEKRKTSAETLGKLMNIHFDSDGFSQEKLSEEQSNFQKIASAPKNHETVVCTGTAQIYNRTIAAVQRWRAARFIDKMNIEDPKFLPNERSAIARQNLSDYAAQRALLEQQSTPVTKTSSETSAKTTSETSAKTTSASAKTTSQTSAKTSSQTSPSTSSSTSTSTKSTSKTTKN